MWDSPDRCSNFIVVQPRTSDNYITPSLHCNGCSVVSTIPYLYCGPVKLRRAHVLGFIVILAHFSLFVSHSFCSINCKNIRSQPAPYRTAVIQPLWLSTKENEKTHTFSKCVDLWRHTKRTRRRVRTNGNPGRFAGEKRTLLIGQGLANHC